MAKAAKPDKAPDLSSFGDALPDQPSTDDLSSYGTAVESPQAPQPALGVGGNAVAFAKGVPAGAAEAVGGAMKGLAVAGARSTPTPIDVEAGLGVDTLNSPWQLPGEPPKDQPVPPQNPVDNALYKAGNAVNSIAPQMSPQERNSLGGTVGTMIGGIAPYAALAAANPALGIAAGFEGMSASTYGHVYDDAIAKGADEATATAAAEKSASAAGILGSLPLGSGKLAQSLIGKILTSGVSFASANEASEYVLQQIAKDYDPKAGYSPEAKRIIASLITGGLMGGLHHAFESKPDEVRIDTADDTRAPPAGSLPGPEPSSSGPDTGAAGAGSQGGPQPGGGPGSGSGGPQGGNQSGTGGGPKPNQGGPGSTQKPPPGTGEGMGADYTMDPKMRAKMERVYRTFEPGQDPSKMSDADLYNAVNEHLRDTSSTGHTAQGDTPEEQAQREAHAKKRDEDQILRDAGWSEPHIQAMTPEQRADYLARAQATRPSERPQQNTTEQAGTATTSSPDKVVSVIDRSSLMARHADESGAIDMRKVGADVANQVKTALDQGKTVTLHVEGKAIPISSVEGGMMRDAEGKPWGTGQLLAPRPGDHARVEIGSAEPVNPTPGTRAAPIKATTAADIDAAVPAEPKSPAQAEAETPDQLTDWLNGDTSKPLKGGEPEAVASDEGSPQLPHAPSDGGRSPVRAGDESQQKSVVAPGNEHTEPTAEHHAQIEAVLGSDFHRVLPVDVARAAEILAENPDLPPHVAFQYAVIENAAQQNLLSPTQLEQIYGPQVRHALQISAGQRSSSEASSEARAEGTTAANAFKSLAPENLLQFIASKGGLKPHPELEALDAHKHLVIMRGFGGRRKLVKDGGLHLDRAREMADEAGYLMGEHNQTSTIRDLLDAIDEGMRGNHRYPLGHEGTKTKRERRRESERERYEQEQHEAAYGQAHKALEAEYPALPLDLRDTAARAMVVDGYDLDTAVEYAAVWQVNHDNKLYEQTEPSIVDTFGQGANDAIHAATASGNGEQALRGRQEEGRSEGSREGDRDGGPVPKARTEGGGEAAQGVGHDRKSPVTPIDKGADNNEQTVIPGAEKASGKTMTQRGANAPLKPKVAQKPADTGLFGDEKNQVDLLDTLNKPAAAPAASSKVDFDDLFDRAVDEQFGGKPAGLNEPGASIQPQGGTAQAQVLELGRATGNEHLRVIDARGKLAFSAEGTTNGIAVTKTMEEAFFDPASDLVIHHNHPRNRSFSDDDISLLASPGIRTIWAHGHSGGIYRVELMPAWRNMIGTRRDDVTGAYRGLRTLWRRIEDLLLQTAHAEALRPGNEALKEAFEIGWAHLINTVLHRGGVIDYKTNFELDPSVLKMEGLSDAMERAVGLLKREFPDAETATVRNNRPAGTVRHPGNMGASFDRAEVARTVGPARRGHQESRENDRSSEKEGLSEPSRVFSFLSQPTSNFDKSFNDLLGKRLLGRLGDLNATEARVQLQDKFLRVQKAEQLKRNTDTQLSAYQAESLYYGRTGYRLEQLREHQIDPLIREMKARDIDLNKLDDFLYARHAVERNQKLGQHYEPGHDFYEAMTDPDKVGGSGMSQNEALGIIRAIRADGKLPDYLAVARMVDALNARTRRVLLDGGLIDRDTFDAMNSTYKYYVPLRGWQEGSDDEHFNFGTGGMETRGKDVKQAFGRKSRAASPLAYSIMQAEGAVVRAEKNKVGNTFLKFVRANPDPDLWVVNRPQMRKEISKVSGLVYNRPDNLSHQDDNVFATKVQGKPVYIRMLGADGLNLARALKNMGSANAHSAVRMLAAVTHTMSRLATAWNPEFMIPNLSRDVSEAFINLGEQRQRQFSRNFAKRVFPAIRGATMALAGKTAPAGSPLAEYVDAFHRFDREGGRIHFFGLDDPDEIERNVDAKLRRLSGGPINNLKDLGEKAGKALEVAGGGLENATRLAAFMAAEDAGMSTPDAAMLARNLTVNFNKKGELGTIVSSLYAFGNAGIQGIARMMRALHPRNTKVWAAVGMLAAANVATTAWDLGAGGKDEAGTYNYMKIPSWERDKNVVVMLTNGYYAKIPLPYGFAPFGVVGSKAATIMAGAEKPTKAAAAVLSSTINAFNPLGDEAEMWREIVPTVFRPLVHIEANKDWTGRAIYPNSDRSKGLPDSTQAFRSTSGASKWVAETLNDLTGGSKYESGAIDVHPGTFDYIVGAVVGGVGHFLKSGWNTIVSGVVDHEWRPETTPVLRRFVGRVGPEADQYAYYQARDEARGEANAVKQARKERRTGDQDAARFVSEHRGESKKSIFDRADRQMRDLRAQEDRVRASAQPYDAKHAAIEQIRQRMREVQNRARVASAKLQQAQRITRP
ncbi:LPD38 domain-containing protein [Bradyrhizobium macuxiense]|nr:LPD38 domain-containing protein [Bradyrhizobium macuxiense]